MIQYDGGSIILFAKQKLGHLINKGRWNEMKPVQRVYGKDKGNLKKGEPALWFVNHLL